MTKNPPGDSGAKQVDARVARRRQDALGRRLRQMYDNVVGEDVPADFLALLEQADGNNQPSSSVKLDGQPASSRDKVGSSK